MKLKKRHKDDPRVSQKELNSEGVLYMGVGAPCGICGETIKHHECEASIQYLPLKKVAHRPCYELATGKYEKERR